MSEPRQDRLEPRQDRLTTLRRNLDRLTREAEELAGSLDRESRLVREEAVGAELLATRDLIAHAGIFWDTAGQLGDLYARQARYFVEDHARTLKSLFDASSASGPLAVLESHLARRLEHVTEGVNEGIEVASTQSGRACNALLELWAPFTAVVRRDWTRQPSPSAASAPAGHEQSPLRRQLP